MYRKFCGHRVKNRSDEDFYEDIEYSSWASLCLTKECDALRIGDCLVSSIGGQLIGSGLTTESIIVRTYEMRCGRTFDIVVPESRIGRDRAPVSYKKMTVSIYTDNNCIGAILIDKDYYEVIE